MRACVRQLLLCSVLLRCTSGFMRPLSRIASTGYTSKVVSTSAIADKRSTLAPVFPHYGPRSSSRLFLSDATRNDRKKRLATGMAFLTGLADVVLFRKYATFATMMTGNLIWMASAAVEQRYKLVGYYACVIASYNLGVAAFRRMDLSLRKKTLRVCSLVVLALFVGSDVVHAFTGTRFLPLMLLAGGFGIINSVGAEVAGTLTFVVTGHMTKITHQVVDRYSRKRGRKRLSAEDRAATLLNTATLSGFFFGALLASFIETRRLFFQGTFSVLGVLYGALFFWLDMESLGGAWWLRKNEEMCEVDDDGEICEEEEEEETTALRNMTMPVGE